MPPSPGTPGYHMNFTDIQGDIHSNTHKTIFAKWRTFQPNHPYFSPPSLPAPPFDILQEKEARSKLISKKKKKKQFQAISDETEVPTFSSGGSAIDIGQGSFFNNKNIQGATYDSGVPNLDSKLVRTFSVNGKSHKTLPK